MDAGSDASGLLDVADWRKAWPPAKWSAQLAEPEDEGLALRLRRCTRTGRPLASDGFLSKLERTLGRRLRPLPVGRPKAEPEAGVEGRKQVTVPIFPKCIEQCEPKHQPNLDCTKTGPGVTTGAHPGGRPWRDQKCGGYCSEAEVVGCMAACLQKHNAPAEVVAGYEDLANGRRAQCDACKAGHPIPEIKVRL